VKSWPHARIWKNAIEQLSNVPAVGRSTNRSTGHDAAVAPAPPNTRIVPLHTTKECTRNVPQIGDVHGNGIPIHKSWEWEWEWEQCTCTWECNSHGHLLRRPLQIEHELTSDQTTALELTT